MLSKNRPLTDTALIQFRKTLRTDPSPLNLRGFTIKQWSGTDIASFGIETLLTEGRLTKRGEGKIFPLDWFTAFYAIEQFTLRKTAVFEKLKHQPGNYSNTDKSVIMRSSIYLPIIANIYYITDQKFESSLF
jgi:butyrate kinase